MLRSALTMLGVLLLQKKGKRKSKKAQGKNLVPTSWGSDRGKKDVQGTGPLFPSPKGEGVLPSEKNLRPMTPALTERGRHSPQGKGPRRRAGGTSLEPSRPQKGGKGGAKPLSTTARVQNEKRFSAQKEADF